VTGIGDFLFREGTIIDFAIKGASDFTETEPGGTVDWQESIFKADPLILIRAVTQVTTLYRADVTAKFKAKYLWRRLGFLHASACRLFKFGRMVKAQLFESERWPCTDG